MEKVTKKVEEMTQEEIKALWKEFDVACDMIATFKKETEEHWGTVKGLRKTLFGVGDEAYKQWKEYINSRCK